MQEILNTEEWEKTIELLREIATEITIYDKKGKKILGKENIPFRETDKPDIIDNRLYMPLNINDENIIMSCKTSISIDKAVKVIQKIINLLKLTLEKNSLHENLSIKCDFLQNTNTAKNTSQMLSATQEFLVHKLKLANCTIKLEKEKRRYFKTNTDEQYDETEKIIERQVQNSKTRQTIKNIPEDFLLNQIEKIEELNYALFAIPLIVDKEYVGTIFCYTDKLTVRKINQAEIIAKEFSHNITKIQELQEAKTNAQTDNLTGLLNRAKLFPYLEKIITNNKEKKPTSIMIFDIDDFKKYNDTNGHMKGDDALRIVAEQASSLPKPAITFRYGGEEFVTILESIDSMDAKKIAEEMREKIEKNSDITISIGCMTSKNSTITPKNMIEEADKALYKAKSQGKNKVVQFISIDKSLGVIDTTQA